MDDELRDEIAKTLRKMLYPSPLMRWMEGLTQAERIGRIKRSKYSVLRYSIRQFVITQLGTVLQGTTHWHDYKLTVVPMNDEVIITGTNPLSPEHNWEITQPYPDWLFDFLDDDDNFPLLLPDCNEKLGEVIQRVYEWCYSHPPYDILVKPA